jgi:hypothetical protein
MDETEGIRRIQTAVINNAVESDDETTERQRLEKEYGQVWNTQELSAEFEVIGFMAPYVVVKRKSDDKKGSLQFQHMPRFYFNFREE